MRMRDRNASCVQQTFEELGKLVMLKFLRLESGGSIKEDTLGRALIKLTRYLHVHIAKQRQNLADFVKYI